MFLASGWSLGMPSNCKKQCREAVGVVFNFTLVWEENNELFIQWVTPFKEDFISSFPNSERIAEQYISESFRVSSLTLGKEHFLGMRTGRPEIMKGPGRKWKQHCCKCSSWAIDGCLMYRWSSSMKKLALYFFLCRSGEQFKGLRSNWLKQ